MDGYRQLEYGRQQTVRVFLAATASRPLGLTGATLGAGSRLYKWAGTAVDISGRTFTEIANGWYDLTLLRTDTDEPGTFTLHLEAAGADPWDAAYQIPAFDRTAADAQLATLYGQRTSPWPLYGTAPVLGAEGSAVDYAYAGAWYDNAGLYNLFYCQGSPLRIYRATSADGYTFTLPGAAAFALTAEDANGAWSPSVWQEAGTWYMIYTGSPSSGVYQACLATSADGTTWTKAGAVFTGGATATDWDYLSAETGNVIKVGSTYYLHYTTLNPAGVLHTDRRCRQIGVATATVLTGPWTANARNPVFAAPAWDRRFAPFVFAYPSSASTLQYYLICTHYMTGFDRYVLELWTSRQPEFYPEDRELVRVIWTPRPATWLDTDVDVASIMTSNAARTTFPDASDVRMYFSVLGSVTTKWTTALAKLGLKAGVAAPLLAHDAVRSRSLSAITTDANGRTEAAEIALKDFDGNTIRKQTAAATYTGNSEVGTTWTETEV